MRLYDLRAFDLIYDVPHNLYCFCHFKQNRWPQVQMARKDLRYFDSLGQGSFGWIVRGRYRASDGLGKPNISNDQSVIVCMLKEEANSDSQRAFLEETQLAAQFSFHFDDVPITNVVTNVDSKNIVKLIGICIEKPPYLAIYEECKLGDLKTFLLDRKELLLANENFSGLMLQFCQNVTSGLHYLHEAQCIPYDLATRCCQVTSSMEIKIGDYGMARNLYPNDYLKIQRFGMEEEVNDDDKLPLRWLPPEILAHLSNKKYEMKKRLKSIPRSSSIWTLGVTLWEIAMLGGTPFSSIYSNQFQNNINVEALLRDASTNGPGAITRKCYGTDAIESMVRLCTAADPAKRPTCQRLIAYLDAISESHIKLSNEKINV